MQGEQALQDASGLKQGAGAHLVRVFLEAVFPVRVAVNVIAAEEVDDLLNFAVADHPSQANVVGVCEWNHDLKATGFDLEKVEFFNVRADGAAGDLLDYAYPVVGINHFIAHLEG